MAPYARREVIGIAIVGAALTWTVAAWWGWWALLPAVIALSLLAFYRDPPRAIALAPNEIGAPADGRIVEVARQVNEDGAHVLRIVIFLSVLNVHINRSPCAGRVLATHYRPGRFLNALRPEATATNEANTIVIEPAAPLPGPIRVRQIAGTLARRIVCTARENGQLAAGQRIGMIKLGSRTEITLPDDENWEVRVAVGTRVRAGLTVLAALRSERST